MVFYTSAPQKAMRKGRFPASGPPQFTICLNFPANPAGGPSGKSQAGMEIAMPCRGGYHPPVRLCNRRLRGARRLGAPSVGATCGRPLIEDAPLAERACPAGAPLSFPKKAVGKKGPGGSAHPGPPNTGVHGGGGLYGQGKDRACIAARSLDVSVYRRCRAPGCTHRDYPAGPDGRCAVPAWPAGPPSAPCLRNTGAAAVAGKRRVKDAAPYIVGPSYGSFASGQARKLIPSAGPPLPTATTPLGRRGGPNFYARPEPGGVTA